MFLFLIKKFFLLRIELDEQSLTVTYIKYGRVNHLKIEKGKSITYEIRPSFYFGDQLTIYVDGQKTLHEFEHPFGNLRLMSKIIDEFF